MHCLRPLHTYLGGYALLFDCSDHIALLAVHNTSRSLLNDCNDHSVLLAALVCT